MRKTAPSCVNLGKKSDSGFTFVEILIVVSLITILSAAAIPGFTSYTKSQNLRQALNQLKDGLRTVQNNAMGGVGADDPDIAYWGATFANGSKTHSLYTFAPLDDGDSSLAFTKADDSNSLPGDIEIKSSITLLFDMFSGNAFVLYNSGSSYTADPCAENGANCLIIIGPEDAASGSSNCSAVFVNTAGAIFKEETHSCP